MFVIEYNWWITFSICCCFRVPPTEAVSQPFFLFRISRYYYCLIGMAITMIAGYIISLFTKSDEKPLRLELVSPLVHSLIPNKKKAVPDRADYCSVDKALAMVTYNNEKEKEANSIA